MPSIQNDSNRNAIKRVTSEVIKKLGITDGPCYVQMKVTENGQVMLIEVAPRQDGCHIWKLIKYCYGVDLLDATFRDLMGDDTVKIDCNYDNKMQYSLEFLSREPNSIFHSADYKTEDAVDLCYYYEEGERILEINGHIEKCGYVIRKGV